MDANEPAALVTGASSGIGAATAETLASEGYAVALVARREARLHEVADGIDGETLVAPADVTDPDAVEAAVEATHERFGRLDVLVTNAGVLHSVQLPDADRSALHDHVQVNLLGTMNATHAALPSLLDSEGPSHVVSVSSMNARYPAGGAGGYSASKAGVNTFCDSLRQEMADEDVRVTIVMPGPVVTEMRDWADWEGRALDPADVAETVAFAVSRPAHVEIPELTVNTTDKM
jgi:hypothetical protein